MPLDTRKLILTSFLFIMLKVYPFYESFRNLFCHLKQIGNLLDFKINCHCVFFFKINDRIKNLRNSNEFKCL
jgi:hypothetical protein